MKVETQKLWDEFRETGDVELRNRLVEKYLYIVKYVADRLQQKLPRSIPNEDLRSAASYGLIRAVENFDHKRGTRFETYCATRVKGAILDDCRRLGLIRRQRAKKATLEAATSRVLEVAVQDHEVMYAFGHLVAVVCSFAGGPRVVAASRSA